MVVDTFPLVRREAAAPEELLHPDEGCEFSLKCLECPLPACRYDNHRAVQGLRLRGRNEQILAAHHAGQTADSIAAQFGINRRTVFRVLRSQASA